MTGPINCFTLRLPFHLRRTGCRRDKCHARATRASVQQAQALPKRKAFCTRCHGVNPVADKVGIIHCELVTLPVKESSYSTPALYSYPALSERRATCPSDVGMPLALRARVIAIVLDVDAANLPFVDAVSLRSCDLLEMFAAVGRQSS